MSPSDSTRSPIFGARHSLELVNPVLDALAIVGALYAVKWVARGGMDDAGVILGLVAVVVFLILSRLTGLSQTGTRGNADREVATIMMTWGVTVMTLAMIGFATRYGQVFARSVMFTWCILAPISIALLRMLVRVIQQSALARGYGARQVAIAGLNHLGRQTDRKSTV